MKPSRFIQLHREMSKSDSFITIESAEGSINALEGKLTNE